MGVGLAERQVVEAPSNDLIEMEFTVCGIRVLCVLVRRHDTAALLVGRCVRRLFAFGRSWETDVQVWQARLLADSNV